jgi:hypothetical protein
MLTTVHRAATIAVATGLAVVAAAGPASADTSWTLEFPAGMFCAFPLTISGEGGQKTARELPAKDGDVRVLTAGKGQALTYTNAATGYHFSTRANGAVSWTIQHTDGSQTLRLMGHNVVLMSPTDVLGPSATVYTGRVVIEVDTAGVWEVVADNGTALDICAELTSA